MSLADPPFPYRLRSGWVNQDAAWYHKPLNWSAVLEAIFWKPVLWVCVIGTLFWIGVSEIVIALIEWANIACRP